MNENERYMAAESNPYDHLIEPDSEPVKSPVILGNAIENRTRKADKTMEIIPLAAAASYGKVSVRGCDQIDVIHMEVEEDLLVPDTLPDMEVILNMDVSTKSGDIYNENGSAGVRGQLELETIYKSAEKYGNNICVIPASVDFSRSINHDENDMVSVKIKRIEHRIINERKYKAKITLEIIVSKNVEKEYMAFEGIEGETLYLRKEPVVMVDMVSRKTKESDLSEELFINDDKIRPVKILKTKVTVTENHRQLTKDKLILNQTLWVQILYLAELASKGNLSNQPMLFQNKIDHTQFINLSESEVTACTTSTSTEKITVEINRESNGFIVRGEIVTEADFYSEVKNDFVVDFYHESEGMTCDRKPEKICVGVSGTSVECTLREGIRMQEDEGDEQRIIYLDAQAVDVNVSVENSAAIIKGKVHMEAIVMDETDRTTVARKICDFNCSKELEQGSTGRVDLNDILIREIKAEITGGEINIMAQLQVKLNIYDEADIYCISNPCIMRSGSPEKHYPITVHVVSEGETVWDIGKKYRIGEDCILAYNKAENISPGNKVVIVR